MSRLSDLKEFYSVLGDLETILGGCRMLKDVSEYSDWPDRGVYFFFEQGEYRNQLDGGNRLVRVGTQALNKGAKSTLRQRLTQHRGSIRGTGNHRGSIFRLLIGDALMRAGLAPNIASWGKKGDFAKAAVALGLDRSQIKGEEYPLEEAVSDYLGSLPFLWLDVDDEPGPDSLRGYLESNSIALLSNYHREPIDPSSEAWLGNSSSREKVSSSGLWNQRHVDEGYDLEFIGVFAKQVERLR
jgi:hypothetical protein